MIKIQITIRYRGRNRRYRRMLRTLPEYGGHIVHAENSRRTIISAQFDDYRRAVHFKLAEGERAIQILEI